MLPKGRSSKDLETRALSLGLPKRYVNTLSAVLTRKKRVPEGIMALHINWNNYKKTLLLHKKLQESPYEFYQNNKKITSVEKKLITFGSLSLSYSFASLHKLLRDIIYGSKLVQGYVGGMQETSDENYSLENVSEDGTFLNDIYLELQVKEKINAFKQDLRGNKISDEIIDALMKKLKFDKRSTIRDGWNLSGITQESIIDSMYIFFGSQKGTEFMQQWENKKNREKLLDEFEFLIYNNPYVNPLLIDHSLKTYMSDEFIESAEYHLKRYNNTDFRTVISEIDFGLDDE